MARFLRFAIVAFLPLFLQACEASDPSLKVVSWNVEWFPGRSPKPSAEEAAEHMQQAQQAIKDLDPDVLLLQEVRDTAAAVELCSVVPGLTVHVASAFPGSSQNLIVASKLPADSGWFDRWKAGPIHPPRGYAFAALELPKGGFLLAYSLHQKSNGGDFLSNIAQRQEATRQLLPHIQEMLAIYGPRGTCAVVVGGDFNTSLEDERFAADLSLRALLTAGLHWTFAGVPFAERVTIPRKGPYPDSTFDHILTGGLGSPRATVRKYAGVSDHRPVIVEIPLAKIDAPVVIDVKAGLAALEPAAAGPFEAGDHSAIAQAIGKKATIRGKISSVSSPSKSITFLNFEGNPRGKFVGIVRKADLDAVTAGLKGTGLKQALEGHTVELTGVLTSYRGTPQIEVRSAEQVRVLP